VLDVELSSTSNDIIFKTQGGASGLWKREYLAGKEVEKSSDSTGEHRKKLEN
jgi:hypothetical protein